MRAVLLTIVAIWLVGDRLNDNFAVRQSYGFQPEAKIYDVDIRGCKNVSPLGVPPIKGHALLVDDLVDVFGAESNRFQIGNASCRQDVVGNIDLGIRFREIEIIRLGLIEILNRKPRSEYGSSSAASIVKLGLDSKAGNLSVFTHDDLFVRSLKTDSRAQLLPSVNLRLAGYSPLLPNKEKARDVGYKQESGEPANDTGPFHHLAVKVAGVLSFLFGCWLTWRCICHDIPQSIPPASPLTVLGLTIAAASMLLGLSLLFS
jgi:hypothetical protein